MRGVPLLPWRRLVCFQNRLDEGPHGLQSRLRSNSNLSFSGNRVRQCFPHHAPVNTQLLRHPLDLSHTVGKLTPDLLKYLHFGSPLQPRPLPAPSPPPAPSVISPSPPVEANY